MKKGLTEIIFVLDESGSMASIKDDAIGGFNEFIKQQKEIPGEAVFTFVKFGTNFETIENATLLENVKPLDTTSYSPGGLTALLDATGCTIDKVLKRHNSLLASEKPEKVIMVVFTDGHENASTEYTSLNKISDLVKEAEKHAWELLFLGADIDAWGAGGQLGFSKTATLDKGDMRLNMKKMSHYTSSYRSVAPEDKSKDFMDSFNLSADQIDKDFKTFKKDK